MSDVDDLDLVRRCQSGDEAAFAELVTRYKDLVYALVVRAVQEPTRADDLAQEAFLRIHRGLPYFRGEARLSTWIFRVVANLCAQERGRHRPEISMEEPGPGSRSREPGRRDSAFDDVELRDRLEKAMARLPLRDRLLIAGHHLKGLQYQELADALDVPLGTVKTHLFRAKQRLRALLEDELK
jgi:RNA polymerase sigma-70 factor (ECF subfamily)